MCGLEDGCPIRKQRAAELGRFSRPGRLSPLKSFGRVAVLQEVLTSNLLQQVPHLRRSGMEEARLVVAWQARRNRCRLKGVRSQPLTEKAATRTPVALVRVYAENDLFGLVLGRVRTC
ncbi:hypothetical protein GCM10010412_098000 [Nonomuraea recticatena]|uniref:Uncharacterized protein n=1 Tax=Nonomuraea recticatena TaxID=46178 RepID=A0ABN3TDH5_9ACTN